MLSHHLRRAVAGAAGPAAAPDTWNPADKSGLVTLSNGNLTAAASGITWEGARSFIGKNSGTGSFEVTVDASSSFDTTIGLCTSASLLTASHPGSAGKWDIICRLGRVYDEGAIDSIVTPINNVGDIVTIEYDFNSDDPTMAIRKNGALIFGPKNFIGAGKIIFPMILLFNLNEQITANFGQAPFAFPVSAGVDEGWFA